MKIVTIKDIAEAAGVYPSAVSTVLNNKNHTRISEERREHIRRIAEELGYRPNFQAKCLRKGKRPAVGVFLPEWKDVLLLEFMQGLSEGANLLDIPLSFHFGLTEQSYSAFIDSMTAYRNTAIISYVPYWMKDYSKISEKIGKYISGGGKVIAINSQIPWVDNVLTLNMDEVYGVKLAAEYLLKCNCGAYFSLNFNNTTSVIRAKIFKEKLNEAEKKCISLELPPKDEFEYMELYEKLNSIINNISRPLGLFATSSGLTGHAVNYLNDKGLKIGSDFKFVSYDGDSPFSDYFPVVRIKQPFKRLGILTMDKLKRMIAGLEATTASLKPELKIPDNGIA